MKFNLTFLSVLILAFTISCAVRTNNVAAVKQGISGRITFEEGNHMPGPGQPASAAQKGVKRDVLIYAVATAAQAEGQRPLFTRIHTKLAARVKSDSTGYFQCSLDPGTYSVVTVEEGGKLFSSISNEKDELSPVEVKADAISAYNIVVNYKAVY
jgi:hypothetical protein